MSIEQPNYSVDQNGYFGITLLGVDGATAKLVSSTIQNAADRESRIYFDEVSTSYNDVEESLTCEGIAISLSNPSFAINSIYAYVETAREINKAA